MASVFNQLLFKLQSKILASIPDSVGTPGIRMVDQDMGQVDFYTVRPAVPFPCLLVDYNNTEYVQQQFKSQWGQMLIKMRLAFDPWSKSNSLAPMDVREKALIYYEIEDKLYLALQDYYADGLLMLPLKRVSAKTEKDRTDKLRIREIIFKATYQDLGLQNGGIYAAPLNPATSRLDWVAEAEINYVQHNSLIGKNIAHIEEVSWEGNDIFEPIAAGDPTEKQVLLDPVLGRLTFKNNFEIGDYIWCNVKND